MSEKINLKYSDKNWDYTFIRMTTLLLQVASAEGAISDKVYDWYSKTTEKLVKFYEENQN